MKVKKQWVKPQAKVVKVENTMNFGGADMAMYTNS